MPRPRRGLAGQGVGVAQVVDPSGSGRRYRIWLVVAGWSTVAVIHAVALDASGAVSLQPHFLLNSLNSILALVEHDSTRAKAMLERLASLLQSVFDRLDEPLVLLERELDTIRDYLRIEQVRFEDRLRFTIDVDGDTEHVTVPPFLLQPLVENAVKHGIQPYTRQGEVRVTAHRQGARVHVAVSDTGSGPKVSQGTSGRGIDLTRRRLRATYGDNGALLSMSREERGGFTVSLDLPVEPERPGGFSSSAVNVS